MNKILPSKQSTLSRPIQWKDGEQDLAQQAVNSLKTDAVMYHGPPPASPAPVSPTIPAISTLASSIVTSPDKLFFIAHSISDPASAEWRLVRVALEDSMALHPACLQDGRFLVEFYTAHTTDTRYNGINQRFWLQYHLKNDFTTPLSTSETHLIQPSDTSFRYALRNNLVPLRLWINLSHTSTYIHGPFNFANIQGRKSRDRISEADWTVLHSHRSMFHNLPPAMDLPVYSIHVDRGAHVSFCSVPHVAFLRASSLLTQASGDQLFR